ncbi:hypothetical protein EDD99_1006 [Streptomyces sp. 846.5]|nr:hypothetical protein [Streptomyces sp. 846.5]TDU02605.1 hypothetical protein EDD99_1006 [Streptomyces sp. 846.5]
MSAPASPTPPYWTTTRVVIALLLGALAVAGLGYGGAHLATEKAGTAADQLLAVPARGDCVTDQRVPASLGIARLVRCDSADARYTVVQTFPGSAAPTARADVPGAEFALLQRASATAPLTWLCVEPLHVVPRWEGE